MYILTIRLNPKKGVKIEVEREIHLQMSIQELFGCKVKKMVIEKQSIKGIYYYPTEDLFYIFIDDYYLDGKYDVISQNLNILTECMMKKSIEKQIQFKGSTPFIERMGIKYVKQLQVDEVYLTMNPFETYFLTMGPFNKDEGNEQITAELVYGKERPDKLAHRCANYLLKIDDIIFCFDRTVSVNRK